MGPNMGGGNENMNMTNVMNQMMGMGGMGQGPQGGNPQMKHKIEDDTGDDHQQPNGPMGMGGNNNFHNSNPMMNPVLMQNMMHMMNMGGNMPR